MPYAFFMFLADPLPGERQADNVINAALADPFLRGVAFFSLASLLFYLIYLKFHRPGIQVDLATKRAIAEAQAMQTTNIVSTASIQAQSVKDAALVLTLSKEHLEGLSDYLEQRRKTTGA